MAFGLWRIPLRVTAFYIVQRIHSNLHSPKPPQPTALQRPLMDMINVEAAFVILRNATDPELSSALQQDTGLSKRLRRILEQGPPPSNSGNAPLFQRQAQQQRPAQQGWPDGPLPAMSTAPTTSASQFGGTGSAQAPDRNWANMSETQSDQGTGAAWSAQDQWQDTSSRSNDPWDAQPPQPSSHGKGSYSKGSPSWGNPGKGKNKFVNADWTQHGAPQGDQWSQSHTTAQGNQWPQSTASHEASQAVPLEPSKHIKTPLRWWGNHPYYQNAKSGHWLCAFQCTKTQCPHGRPPCHYKPEAIAQDVHAPHKCSLCKSEEMAPEKVSWRLCAARSTCMP